MGLNDSAWEALFQKYDILSRIAAEGQFFISANQIKEFREPRLMTKFDHRVNLPALFADNVTLDGGYVAADETTRTNLPGVYAVGDVRRKPLRQVVTAVADGAMASHFIEEYLSQQDTL